MHECAVWFVCSLGVSGNDFEDIQLRKSTEPNVEKIQTATASKQVADTRYAATLERRSEVSMLLAEVTKSLTDGKPLGGDCSRVPHLEKRLASIRSEREQLSALLEAPAPPPPGADAANVWDGTERGGSDTGRRLSSRPGGVPSGEGRGGKQAHTSKKQT